MTTSIAPESVSTGRLWAGGIITGLVVAFLVFDGVTKIMRVAPVVEASQKLGMTTGSLPAIGLVLLLCTALYVIPSTAILGAILLTGFLGGATAIHVRAESGAFPVVFSIAFGVLAWAGLVLREPRLLWWILQRQ
jgi:hypothetical protein